jgi:hypothetical protein
MDLRNLPLAATPAGKAFAIKCLHPADHEIKTVRGPGGRVPSVGIASDMVETIAWPAGATYARIVQLANPAYPLFVDFRDAADANVKWYAWANAALGGPGVQENPTTPAKYAWMQGIANRIVAHRVMAQSVTCDVIAPAVANQGTIVSAQMSLPPQTVNFSSGNYDGSWALTGVNHVCDGYIYPWPPPTSAQLLMGTSAYTSRAVDGFYQPLKLDRFKFINTYDNFLPLNGVPDQVGTPNVSTGMGQWPYYLPGNVYNMASASFPKPSSNIVGITFIEGTAGNPSVSLRLRCRQVLEIVPKIGSTMAPLAEAPFPPDELAYKMVVEIGARMKDAYPASYNSLGKLRETIAKIGKAVLKYADPVLDVMSVIPGVGSVASGLKVASKVGKSIMAGIDKLDGTGEVRKPLPAPRQQAPRQAQSRARGRTRARSKKGSSRRAASS